MLPAARRTDARRKLQRLKELESRIQDLNDELQDCENAVQIDAQTAKRNLRNIRYARAFDAAAEGAAARA